MSNLLFKTRFKGTDIGSPVAAGSAVKFPVTGANEGYDWACAGLNADNVNIQLISNDSVVTPTNYLDFGNATLIPVTNAELAGYYGNAIHMELKDTGLAGSHHANVGWGGQNMLIIQRIANGTNPLPPVMTDLYMTSTFKLPATFYGSGMEAGNPGGRADTTLWQFKTGGHVVAGQVTYQGDLRFVGQLTKNSSGGLEIKVHADNNANGPWTGNPDLWEYSAPVPSNFDINGYNQIEIFVHRHATAGVVKVAVNGVVVHNLSGLVLMGPGNYDIGRIFACPVYTGANLGLETIDFAKLKYFDGIPGGSVLL